MAPNSNSPPTQPRTHRRAAGDRSVLKAAVLACIAATVSAAVAAHALIAACTDSTAGCHPTDTGAITTAAVCTAAVLAALTGPAVTEHLTRHNNTVPAPLWAVAALPAAATAAAVGAHLTI